MVKKLLLGCGLPLLIVGLLLVGAARSLLKAHPKTERSEAVSRGDVEVQVIETGTIEPLKKVEVKSKVGGRVLNLLVEENARVTQGQTLALIDPQEVNSQVAALRAQLAGAQARLASARKNTTYQTSQTGTSITQYLQNVAVTRARLRNAEAEAKAQPGLTRANVQSAQAALDAARATLKAQQDSLRLLTESTHPNNISTAQANYDQAKAQLTNAQRNVERQQKLLAKGFVSQRDVDTAGLETSVDESRLRSAKDIYDRIRQTNTLEVANARSQIANAQEQVNRAQAELLQAQATTLPATKQGELESARAAYAQANAQLDAARSGRTQDAMRADDATAAAAEVQQIENQLKERLVNQRDTTILAAMSGVVTKRYVEQGELITSAISSFSSGSPIYQISDLATMLVKLDVNEVDIGRVQRGLATEVTIDAARDAKFIGRVRKVSPAATGTGSTDSSSSSSGTAATEKVIRFPVEIQIDNADPRLKPGMSAHCTIVVARHKNVLRIPSSCVKGNGSVGTVQIVTKTVKDGQPIEIATPRQVQVGLRGDTFVEIVSGLREGEWVRPAPYTGPPRKDIEMGGP